MRKITRLFSLAAVAAVCTLAHQAGAQSTIYATGFEPPTYNTGNLNGQDSWVVDGTATVTTAAPGAGEGTQYVSQAAGSQISRNISSGAANQVIVLGKYRGEGVQVLQNPSDATPMAAVVGFQFVDANNFTVKAWDGATDTYKPETNVATFSTSTWHDVAILLNFENHEYSVIVDGTPIVTNIQFHNTTVSSMSQFLAAAQTTANVDGLRFLATSDTGDFDNDSFTDVEELTFGSDPFDVASSPKSMTIDYILGRTTLTPSQVTLANTNSATEGNPTVIDAADVVKSSVDQ